MPGADADTTVFDAFENDKLTGGGECRAEGLQHNRMHWGTNQWGFRHQKL